MRRLGRRGRDTAWWLRAYAGATGVSLVALGGAGLLFLPTRGPAAGGVFQILVGVLFVYAVLAPRRSPEAAHGPERVVLGARGRKVLGGTAGTVTRESTFHQRGAGFEEGGTGSLLGSPLAGRRILADSLRRPIPDLASSSISWRASTCATPPIVTICVG